VPNPRHVGVAVAGDPIGVKRDGRPESGLEAGHGLVREAVDQVDVDPLEPRRPRQLHRLPDHRLRLRPPDRGLNRRIEVLQPKLMRR
jgi:hypothetical protein